MREKLDAFLTAVTDGLALVGAAGVVVMLVHVVAYVVLRLLASAPVPATVEVVSYYYMVLVAFLPIAWAERRGDMIAIDIFEPLFPRRSKPWIAVFVALVSGCVYVALTCTTWLVAMREFEAGSFVMSLNVAIPTWPSYFILPAAFALAALVTLCRLLVPARTKPSEGPMP